MQVVKVSFPALRVGFTHSLVSSKSLILCSFPAVVTRRQGNLQRRRSTRRMVVLIGLSAELPVNLFYAFFPGLHQ